MVIERVNRRNHGQTDGRTEGKTDRGMDRRMDKQNRRKLYTSLAYFVRGYNYLLVHTISHSVYQSHIANKKTLSSCRSFFVVSGVQKHPIARSVLAVSESVLNFRTVNFLANQNF